MKRLALAALLLLPCAVSLAGDPPPPAPAPGGPGAASAPALSEEEEARALAAARLRFAREARAAAEIQAQEDLRQAEAALARDAEERAREGRPLEFATLARHAPGEVGIASTRDPAAQDDAATAALREAARALADCWRRGAAAEADALLAATPGLVAWDGAAAAGVRVHAWFRQSTRTGRLGVTVARSEAGAPVAIAFPPGTYGAAPAVQDLVFLRAAVVVLATGEREARVDVPVACGNYHAGGPRAALAFELRRYPASSPMARLGAVLCAGNPAAEDATQLAIWIAANRVTRDEIGSGGGATFESRRPVGAASAAGAADLLRRAGVDGAPYFEPASSSEGELDARPM